MTMTDIVLPIVKGVVTIFIIGFLAWFIYIVMKRTGFLKLLKRKVKPTEEIYVEVAKWINKGKPFDEIVQKFSKHPKKLQDKYVQAYIEIKDLKQEEGKLPKIE